MSADPNHPKDEAAHGIDSSSESTETKADSAQSEPNFRRWQWGKKAEYDKLMGHIKVLRLRVERQVDSTNEPSNRRVEMKLAKKLLEDSKSWLRGDENAHVHADALEEVLPLIAGDDEVDAMFELELDRPHDGVSLADVVAASTLAELTPASRQRLSAEGFELVSDRDISARKRAALSKLYRVRADRLRHERLMGKHRWHYLPVLAGIILFTLLVAGFAIGCGTTAETSSERGMPIGAEIVTVVALGGLGGALAATFKIREVAELNSFRVAIAYASVQPIVGAAFGFLGLVLLLTGIVSFSQPSQPWALAAVVAFAAGFSEPFALGIVDRATGSFRGQPAG